MIAEPPFDVGGLAEIIANPLPAIAVTFVGTPGTESEAAGVTVFDAADAAPAPIALVALTVKA